MPKLNFATAIAIARTARGFGTNRFQLNAFRSLSPQSTNLPCPLSLISAFNVSLGVSDAGVKWPNDIWVNRKKLAGILTDSSIMGSSVLAMVGVGVRCLPTVLNILSLHLGNSHSLKVCSEPGRRVSIFGDRRNFVL